MEKLNYEEYNIENKGSIESLYKKCGEIFILEKNELFILCNFCHRKYTDFLYFSEHLLHQHTMSNSDENENKSIQYIEENDTFLEIINLENRIELSPIHFDSENLNEESETEISLAANTKLESNIEDTSTNVETAETKVQDEGNKPVLKMKKKSNPLPKICPICGALKSTSSNLKFHMNVHLGLKPYECKICGIKFANQPNLATHRKKHEGKPKHKCNYCEKLFYKPSARKVHERYHTGERSSICDICGKTFSNTSEMNQHRECHDEIPKHNCGICNKLFKSKKSLRDHKVIHDPKTFFKCSICGKQFPLKKRLTNHLKIHSEVKEYQCKLCTKRFAQASGLYCHLKSHDIDKSKTNLDVFI